MKLRHAIIFAVSAILLAACNFSLAADVTPPPGYVSPTPPPTLGPLFPAASPNIANGAAIYTEKCLPCHGATGMGDGPQSADLPAKVAALGLPTTAMVASPANWFSVVTQGRIEKFMPPFNSLSDQDRWDVISYALTLHTTPAQIETGKNLFEANCSGDCAKKFTDLKAMSALTEKDIVAMIKKGDGAFGSKFTDDEATAVAVYIRTLTFAAAQPTPTTVSVTETPIAAEAGTPSVVTTPIEGTQQAGATPEATTVAGVININGTVESATSLPGGLTITLHGYDHVDQTSGPQEVFTGSAPLNADSTYNFKNIEAPKGRIFIAELDYQGIKYQSDFTVAVENQTELAMNPVKVQEVSADVTLLQFQQIHLYSDFANDGFTQFLEIYTFVNSSDKVINIPTDGKSLPFIVLPDGATNVGFELSQDSAPITASTDGIAIVPTDKAYSLVVFFNLPYKGDPLTIQQKFVLDTPSVLMVIPEGIKLKSDQLISGGIQPIQNKNFQTFNASDLKAGSTLTFTVSGKPKLDSSTVNLTQNQNLLIGVGGLGIALIIAGVWLYWRDNRKTKNRIDDEDDDEEAYGDADSILDAIVAIDDLHREGKISDEAYQKRRAELKSALKKG